MKPDKHARRTTIDVALGGEAVALKQRVCCLCSEEQPIALAYAWPTHEASLCFTCVQLVYYGALRARALTETPAATIADEYRQMSEKIAKEQP